MPRTDLLGPSGRAAARPSRVSGRWSSAHRQPHGRRRDMQLRGLPGWISKTRTTRGSGMARRVSSLLASTLAPVRTDKEGIVASPPGLCQCWRRTGGDGQRRLLRRAWRRSRGRRGECPREERERCWITAMRRERVTRVASEALLCLANRRGMSVSRNAMRATPFSAVRSVVQLRSGRGFTMVEMPAHWSCCPWACSV